MANYETLAKIRQVTRRGGSLALNIPSEIVKDMGLAEGSSVVFEYDSKKKLFSVDLVRAIETQNGRNIELAESRRKL
jgi:antitoxin component of MazEF toxin-antitoxin module